MRIGIMQPYFFPYIGYFQLIHAVDEFVIYDNIEYTKKGWINRNRILVNGSDSYITLPLKKDSDHLHVKDRSLAEAWPTHRRKILNMVRGAYCKAPYFDSVYPAVERAMPESESNLFGCLLVSLQTIRDYLGIETPLVISSTIPIDHHILKAEQKVLAICKARGASEYVNPIGGTGLYDTGQFGRENIQLHFLQSNDITYRQYTDTFVPSLSILDVLMFSSIDTVRTMLDSYSLQ
jgi:hypothetical protein